jgi:hypothetical protein
MPRPQVPLDCHRRSHWARDWRLGALVGLLVLLVVGDLPVVHNHDDPGLYNEECPLSRFATSPPGVTAPDAMPARGPLPICEALVPPAWVEVSLAPIAPSAPRAPPAVV